MALNPKVSNLGANTAANAVTALLNSGYLRIYDGAQPANADTAITTQTKLAELRFNATAFAAAVAGVATANAIVSDTNTVAGTAAWFRLLESDGTTVICDGSVGTAGCDINLNTTSIASGGTLAMSSFTYTQSKG
jgi:hypothetical protein